MQSQADDGQHGSDAEARQLRETVRALRAALEQAREDEQSAVLNAVRDAKHEIQRLRETVQEMRQQTERVHFEHERALTAAKQNANEVIRQLEDTVRALRARLEERGRSADA